MKFLDNFVSATELNTWPLESCLSGWKDETKNPYCCKVGELLSRDSVRSHLFHHHLHEERLQSSGNPGTDSCTWELRYPVLSSDCGNSQIITRHIPQCATGDLAGNSKETAPSVTPPTCKGAGIEDQLNNVPICLPLPPDVAQCLCTLCEALCLALWEVLPRL